MSKSYTLYYSNYRVLCQTNLKDPKDETSLKLGEIYISSRFVDTLLLNNGLYKALGFYLLSDITRTGRGSVKVPTTINLGQQSDGERISLFRVFSIVLVPKDTTYTVAPFGIRYPTRVPASFTLNDTEVASVLYGATFIFLAGGVTAEYVVESGTAQQIRSKKSPIKLPTR